MYLPGSYLPALLLLVVCMLCWGSWANTQKLARSLSFELFYWDYVLGTVLSSVAFGLTLGSTGDLANGLPFGASLSQAASHNLGLALFSGGLFSVANVLLVAAIAVAGMAVAFPVGIGLALLVGTVGNYLVLPAGNPKLLFGGMTLVAVAIALDASAYRRLAAAKPPAAQPASARLGILLSLACGVLMGLFYPFFAKSLAGPGNLTPYSGFFVFSIGSIVGTVPVIAYLMRRPVRGKPVRAAQYFSMPGHWHLFGILGGVIWSVGTMFNFVVAAKPGLVGPAVSYSLGQGATLVSALWGIFIWREFQGAGPQVQRRLALMFACFLAGLASIAAAPLVP